MRYPSIRRIARAFVFGVVALGLFQHSVPNVAAQTNDAPFFETRAVWLATVLRDGNWPVTGAPASQQESALRDLIRNAHRLGMNTFYFQAVARGDAMYPSSRLPWSALLKGAGEDPGFDPLAVAIEEAHRHGMELHAWFNVFRAGDTGTVSAFENAPGPTHVFFAQPGWVAQNGSEIWIDPNAAEARSWLIENMVEIVENYDVDGIHYDFLRYPQGGLLTDDANFQFDNRGFSDVGDWRRDNVNKFAQEAHARLSPLKPWLKIGAAPLGNYRKTSAWPGFWAYEDAFQESRKWLEAGWVDYLAPQIYFSTGTAPEGNNTFASPDFTVLVNEWVAESAGRPIVAGMAAYKPAEGHFPSSDLLKQIDESRAAGASGQAVFRYEHLVRFEDLFASQYATPSLSTPMAHRFEAAAPTTPPGFSVIEEAAGLSLSWLPAAAGNSTDPVRSYLIFRRAGMPPATDDAKDLLTVVDAGTTTYTDARNDDKIYFYRIAARSALGMLSPATEPASGGVATSVIQPVAQLRTTIVSLFPNPVRQNARLVYHIAHAKHMELILYDTVGRQARQLYAGVVSAGTHTTSIDTRHLTSGVYQVVLRTADTVSSWPMMINR